MTPLLLPSFRPRQRAVPPAAALRAAMVLLASWATPAAAQRERLTVRVERVGSAEVTVPPGSVARDAFWQESMQLYLGHRFVRQQGNIIAVVGGQWRAVRATLPSQRVLVNDATTLHVAAADLMVLRTFGSKHTLVSVLRPGMYGDRFRVEGAAFMDRIVTPRTTVDVGLSYASSFGKLLPIPVVHVVSRPKRRLLVDALLPARGDLWWMPRKGLDIGLNASLVGAQYGLSAAQQVAGGTELWLANATVGPQLRWAPRGSKWQLTGEAGTTVLRRLEYARNDRSVADLAPGNVPFARLGVNRLF